MIEFKYQKSDTGPIGDETKRWLLDVAASEDAEVLNLSYVFCDDDYLLELNKQFLNHDTYTDVICFDDSLGKSIRAEVYVSVDRVRENALTYRVTEKDELHRVMVHALLHCLGYRDKSKADSLLMRQREDSALKLRPA
jgi:probable rRNA maturation factor